MFGTSRFNLLVVALITFVSFVTARTVITSQTCTTRYCGYAVPQNKIFKTTKTIHKSARYTVTRWKTVSKPKSVFWTGTSTHTRKSTNTIYKATTTITLPVTTKTIPTSTITIPVPAGFTGVAEDPDNKAALTQPVFVPKRDAPVLDVELDRRSAEPAPAPAPEPEPEPEPVPEPEPAAKGKHVTAITCTKTLITKTGTSDLWKTTTKWGGISTKTVVVSTKTIFPPIVSTIRTTTITATIVTSKDKVVFATSWTSATVFTTSTKYLSTVTKDFPVETYHPSCGARNISPPDRFSTSWSAWETNAFADENVHAIMSNGTNYDCCVACHTWNQGGTCIGSVWRSTIFEGDPPPCAFDPDPECDDTPFEPEFRSKCELIIASSSAPAQCRKHNYSFYTTGSEPRAAVSNGLSCKRFKFTRFW
ncbi:hypothetical protein TWF102_006638 [Orbilia oligospora]|uniref:Uncharacterized protein n=1 Tax=Orbilia oligospora TaxID=2813651 RepID=A0A7C8J8J5_ORBOL|nr:hypothetical protein TWF102_006638 [Orbilia oligospora]KAF3118362.1 hypothetical protein TWF103_000367 [Orbilia oligospora]